MVRAIMCILASTALTACAGGSSGNKEPGSASDAAASQNVRDGAGSGGRASAPAPAAGEDGGSRTCTPQEPPNDPRCSCPAPMPNSACDTSLHGTTCSYDITTTERGGYLCTCRTDAWRCSGPLP